MRYDTNHITLQCPLCGKCNVGKEAEGELIFEFNYLILGTAFVEERNSISISILLFFDFERSTASEE